MLLPMMKLDSMSKNAKNVIKFGLIVKFVAFPQKYLELNAQNAKKLVPKNFPIKSNMNKTMIMNINSATYVQVNGCCQIQAIASLAGKSRSFNIVRSVRFICFLEILLAVSATNC